LDCSINKSYDTLALYHTTAAFAQLKTTVTLCVFADDSSHFLKLAWKKTSQTNLRHNLF